MAQKARKMTTFQSFFFGKSKKKLQLQTELLDKYRALYRKLLLLPTDPTK